MRALAGLALGLGLVLAAALAPTGCGGAPEGTPPPVLALVVFDGFELDALERASADGLLPFERPWSPLEGAGPSRTATLATLLLGVPPHAHGVLEARDVGAHRAADEARADALAARLAARDVATAAAVQAPHLGPAGVGLDAGFERWFDGARLPGADPEGPASRPFVPAAWPPANPLAAAVELAEDGGGAPGAGGAARAGFALVQFEGLPLPPSDAALVLLADPQAEREGVGLPSRRGAYARWFPAADPDLAAEVGAELQAEIATLAAARELGELIERLGRRRGALAGERLRGLLVDLWLERVGEWLGRAAERSGAGRIDWVALAVGPDPAASTVHLARGARLAGGPLDGLRALPAVADALVATHDGARSVEGPWSRPAPEPEACAGLELWFGPGHRFELELRLASGAVRAVELTGGERVGDRDDRVLARLDTTDGRPAHLRVRLDARAVPARLALTRDGAPLPPEALRLAGGSAADLPLPRPVPARGDPWPEGDRAAGGRAPDASQGARPGPPDVSGARIDGPEGGARAEASAPPAGAGGGAAGEDPPGGARRPALVVSSVGPLLAARGAGLEPAASRAGAWPPDIPLAPLDPAGRFPRAAGAAEAVALVVDGRVAPLETLDWLGRRPAPEALELVLPGGLDPDLARRALFAELPAAPGPGTVHVRRLGPPFATGAAVNAPARRFLERLPEGR